MHHGCFWGFEWKLAFKDGRWRGYHLQRVLCKAVLLFYYPLISCYFNFAVIFMSHILYFCSPMSDLKLTLDFRHGIQLLFNREPLLKGKHIFPVHNLLNRCRKQKEKGLDFFCLILLWAKCMWLICGMGWGIHSDWFVVCRLGPFIWIVYVSTTCLLPLSHEYYGITIRNCQPLLFFLKNVKLIETTLT